MTEPLIPPSSGGLSTYRAANWAVQVDTTPTGEEPTWEFWRGISKFDPSQDPTMQDDTDIDSGGFKSQQVTATSLDIAVEGLFKGVRGVDGVTPLNPGCAYVRSLRLKVGIENELHLRFWRTDGLESSAWEHYFAVGWKDVGGSNEELQKFTADLKGRGKPKEIAKPVDSNDDGVADEIASSIITLGGTTAAAGTVVVDADGTEYEWAYNAAAAAITTELDGAGTATGSASPWTITWADPKPGTVTGERGAALTVGTTVDVANTLV